jgi:hypothetical protein
VTAISQSRCLPLFVAGIPEINRHKQLITSAISAVVSYLGISFQWQKRLTILMNLSEIISLSCSIACLPNQPGTLPCLDMYEQLKLDEIARTALNPRACFCCV